MVLCQVDNQFFQFFVIGVVLVIQFFYGCGILQGISLCIDGIQRIDQFLDAVIVFNVFFENRALEAVRAVSFGEYRYSDTYVKFNGYANLETFNDVSEEIDISELAEYIKEHPEDFDDIELTSELEDFIRESYEKVKYVWKKSLSKYYVYKGDEEIYFIDKFHTNKHWLDRLGTLDVMYGELD